MGTEARTLAEAGAILVEAPLRFYAERDFAEPRADPHGERRNIGRRATLMSPVQYEVDALRDLAKRTRDLARRTRVTFRRKRLLALAERYEAKAAEIERSGKLPETTDS